MHSLIINDLQEKFRLQECKPQGNAQQFIDLLNDIKTKKSELQCQLSTYDECSPTMPKTRASTTQSSRQTITIIPQPDYQIQIEEAKTLQLENVIQQMKIKIRDNKKHTDQIQFAIKKFDSQMQEAKKEQEFSDKQSITSKGRIVDIQQLLEIVDGINNNKKMILADKCNKIQTDVAQLMNNYEQFKQKHAQLLKIIEDQQKILKQLNQINKIKLAKQQEQVTVVYYANTLALLDQMFFSGDINKLLEYKFTTKLEQAKVKVLTNPEEMFATQIQVQTDEETEEVDEPDDAIMKLIKLNENNLVKSIDDFPIELELQTFAESIITKYTVFKQQSISLTLQFIDLNNKKHQSQEIFANLKYQKYAESSSGLLPISLKDNQSAPIVTLNILSTSVEPLLNKLRNEDMVRNIQGVVHRLYSFLKDFTNRLNKLIQGIHNLSNMVPIQIISLSRDAKQSFMLKELLQTPKQLHSSHSSMTMDIDRDVVAAKHSRLIHKEMPNSMHVPRIGKANSQNLCRFKFQGIIASYLKELVKDDVERLFLTQEMIDKFLEDVNEECSDSKVDEEDLHGILTRARDCLRYQIRQKTSALIQNIIMKVGAVYDKIREQKFEITQKGIHLEEVKYKIGECLSINPNLEYIHKAHQNAAQKQVIKLADLNFSEPVQINSPGQTTESTHDLFHFLRRMVKPSPKILQDIKREESNDGDDDNIDNARRRVKRQASYVKQQIQEDPRRKSEDINVINRLYPKPEFSNANFVEKMGFLKSMRLSSKSNAPQVENNLRSLITPSQWPLQRSKSKHTFRQSYNQSLSLTKDLMRPSQSTQVSKFEDSSNHKHRSLKAMKQLVSKFPPAKN